MTWEGSCVGGGGGVEGMGGVVEKGMATKKRATKKRATKSGHGKQEAREVVRRRNRVLVLAIRWAREAEQLQDFNSASQHLLKAIQRYEEVQGLASPAGPGEEWWKGGG